MKTRVLISILFLSYTFSFAQTQMKTDDFVTVKYKLCENILSCQAMAYTILDEKDGQIKKYLVAKGNDYYNRAIILKENPHYGELNDTLRKRISIVLDSYSQIFNEFFAPNGPNITRGTKAYVVVDVMLAKLMKLYIQVILPGLLDKK